MAAFETEFHQTIPERQRRYAIPSDWAESYQVKRWGFHGASHRYIAERTAAVMGRDDLRVISCHLGGSSSLCAIRNGASVSTTMGMSPQTGLPQNNRVGDFDPFALPWLMERTGKTLPELLQTLANESGLAGLSGTSGDVRDLENAAVEGDAKAQLALEVYTTDIRRQLGGLLVELGGADVLVNNAGLKQLPLVGEEYSVAEVTIELWDEVINTNLRGCFLCTKAVLPGMLNRESGRIIHVTSGHGKKGRIKRSPYVSSKFGAEGFHWTLSLELVNTPVDSLVFTPPPGGVRTNEAAYVEDPLKNMNHDPDVIIKPMVKLASGEGRNGGRYRGKGDGEGYEETDYIFEN